MQLYRTLPENGEIKKEQKKLTVNVYSNEPRILRYLRNLNFVDNAFFKSKMDVFRFPLKGFVFFLLSFIAFLI